MIHTKLRHLVLAIGLMAAGSAQADYVGSLGNIGAPASVAFLNSTNAGTLTLSALPLPAPYNFNDQWTFTLGGNASVTSLVAAFNFAAGSGTFGIDNLRVNLLNSMGVVATGWQVVSTTGPFTQLISMTPAQGLVAGNYTLQVRGQLLAPPAAYSGSLIAVGEVPTAVPLPAALPMLLLGLGALGAAARKRKQR
ncbi:MAG: FxDxF family PEP-CTERM protein [Cytophagales bacterium]|nr:FxDxF family PEP-CTERM protein [Rhizobacter sp.]